MNTTRGRNLQTFGEALPPERRLVGRLLCVIASALFGLTTAGGETIITIRGSDTMVLLAQRWAERYMQLHPDVTIQVTGGGSGAGFAALLTGTAEISFASRPLQARERELLEKRFGTRGTSIGVALDGLSLFVNERNPVRELTIDQIREIYTGRISNWRDVGGNDAPITLYSRDHSSGTHMYFQEEVLDGEEYALTARSMPGTAQVVDAVTQDKNGIGYGGVAYGRGIRFVAVRTDSQSAAVLPTTENILNGMYPFSRQLYAFLRETPKGEVQRFIEWVLGDEGQAIVTEVGYYALRPRGVATSP
jgi:phosphate transport system substrate-binding protein